MPMVQFTRLFSPDLTHETVDPPSAARIKQLITKLRGCSIFFAELRCGGDDLISTRLRLAGS
jgi:hypothetical protein